MNDYELDDVDVKCTTGMMKQIQSHVTKLRQLQWEMISAEEAYRQAEKNYLEYSRNIMPDLFKNNGLNELRTDDNTLVRIVTKTNCSINKNEKDKENVAKWLEEHGASSLIKSECVVPISQLCKLKEANITFEKVSNMNTNSVKAFVLDELGQRGNPASITREDLPKGLNFFQYDEVEVIK